MLLYPRAVIPSDMFECLEARVNADSWLLADVLCSVLFTHQSAHPAESFQMCAVPHQLDSVTVHVDLWQT